MRDEILSQSEIKVLVAYFSYSGTTRNITNAISEKTRGDLFEITLQDGYSNVYMESSSEIRGNRRPALANTVKNMEEYDIVFVGYPVWWHATPAPINTFLESYDLTGKLIIPFCTSGRSDIDETMPTFLNSCDSLAVYGGRRISGISQIDGWLAELGVTGNIVQTDDETQAEPLESETAVSEGGKETTVVSGENGKALIAYFSWSPSGNTERMATYIQDQIGGDLLELEPLSPYPTNYGECGEVALVERDENVRPEITNLPDSISEYDTVFVGYPIWWHTVPMIIGTFLENYDLCGVEVYPFAQSSSMDAEDFENSMEFIRESATGANVHDGLFTVASNTDGILTYLAENGFVE